MYQNVRVQNIRGGKEKWISGTVVDIKAPNLYIVRVQGNKHRFVQADHMIHNNISPRRLTWLAVVGFQSFLKSLGACLTLICLQ